jgi:hypothetical protein
MNILLRLTLDTNCFINLENSNGQHESVRSLIQDHRAGRISVHIPEMAASENPKDGRPITNFAEFEKWLEGLGCADLPRVRPLLYFGVGFWNHALYRSRELRAREEELHNVLHPGVLFNYQEYCRVHEIDPTGPLDRRWRNAKCDVQMIWSHIHAGNDVFVTEDQHFHSIARRERLLALGAREILTPEQTVATLGGL